MDTTDTTCECSEDFGPCEAHREVLVIREGASLYSADEQCVNFIRDALEITRDRERRALSPRDQEGFERLAETLEGARHLGVAWFADPDDADEIHFLADTAQAHLPWNVGVAWDDGYVIYRITGGPLLSH